MVIADEPISFSFLFIDFSSISFEARKTTLANSASARQI
jgi:hypothetical protein